MPSAREKETGCTCKSGAGLKVTLFSQHTGPVFSLHSSRSSDEAALPAAIAPVLSTIPSMFLFNKHFQNGDSSAPVPCELKSHRHNRKDRLFMSVVLFFFPFVLPARSKRQDQGRYHLKYNGLLCLSELTSASERGEGELQGNGDNEEQRKLLLWCGFPTLIARHPKPPGSWADGSAAVCACLHLCVSRTQVFQLYSARKQLFPPSFSRGGSFGEVGTPTIVSENKKEAEVGGGRAAHPLLRDSGFPAGQPHSARCKSEGRCMIREVFQMHVAQRPMCSHCAEITWEQAWDTRPVLGHVTLSAHLPLHRE